MNNNVALSSCELFCIYRRRKQQITICGKSVLGAICKYQQDKINLDDVLPLKALFV